MDIVCTERSAKLPLPGRSRVRYHLAGLLWEVDFMGQIKSMACSWHENLFGWETAHTHSLQVFFFTEDFLCPEKVDPDLLRREFLTVHVSRPVKKNASPTIIVNPQLLCFPQVPLRTSTCVEVSLSFKE